MSAHLIVITGAYGQLGQEFQSLAADYTDFDFLFASSEDLDIVNRKACLEFFEKYAPKVVINCAAYTKVDQAEEDTELAFQVNDLGSGNLAEASRIHNSFLVHFSTDYVYADNVMRPLTEEDPCEPQSVYGRSKLAGERAIQNSDVNHVILRVSWMYSSYGHNFVKTMMRLGAEREVLSVVNDQFGTPTYAKDLAKATFEIINQCKGKQYLHKGIYNYSNLGQTTWYEFASEIFRLTGMKVTVNPVSSAEFVTRAKRPSWSVLSKDKVVSEFELRIPEWEESLASCLEEIERIN